MTTPLRDHGAGMSFAPELLVRQMLIEGVLELAGDERRMEELFERLDSMGQGSQELWVKDLKDFVQELAERDSRGALAVGIGYPLEDAVFPFVSIVVDSGSENGAENTIGDVHSREYEQTGEPDADTPADSRSYRHTHLGRGWTSNLQIGSWSVSAEASVVLHSIVRSLLIRHKGRLIDAGIHEITLSESGFQPDAQRWPRIGYVPFIRCSMNWTLRQTRRTGPVCTRTTVTAVRGSTG